MHRKWKPRFTIQRPSQDNPEYAVFSIDGLADAPGLDEHWASILLSKIDQYAAEEKHIVVVSKRAYISSDGTDLSEYYVRLGFEKVVMGQGLPVLVYTKGWSQKKRFFGRKEVRHDQIMVGTNLWTGN